MRVLQVTGAYPPTIGGGPTLTENITTHLRDLGHEIAVVTTDPDDGDQVDPAVYRARAKMVAGAPVAPSFPIVLESVIRSFEPDVIHSYYPLPFYPDVAAVRAALSHIPFVLTCSGAWEASLGSVIGTLGLAYNNTLLKGTLRLTDVAHTVSTSVFTDIDTYDGYEDLFTVIPPGVDTSEFDPSRVTIEPPFEREEGKPVILFVGVLRRYKGLDVLIRALNRLQNETDAKLAIVGDGPRRNHLKQQIERCGVDESVEMLGHVSNEELLAAYSAADVFVLPSPTIKESFGIVTSEALSMGTPVVVSRGCGSGRYLDGAEVGTVVKPGSPSALADGLATLLTNEDRYQREEAAARPFAIEHFDWENLIDEYASLYTTAIR